jgi:hypothetical protein
MTYLHRVLASNLFDLAICKDKSKTDCLAITLQHPKTYHYRNYAFDHCLNFQRPNQKLALLKYQIIALRRHPRYYLQPGKLQLESEQKIKIIRSPEFNV